ncbi:TolC family protein [Tundrisphaera sp. TA3]|uniref:TolC family protein n=1 Tax=Tundrisphaera sp. TA3 TaxID=3435775 RepID=UPI003EB80653
MRSMEMVRRAIVGRIEGNPGTAAWDRSAPGVRFLLLSLALGGIAPAPGWAQVSAPPAAAHRRGAGLFRAAGPAIPPRPHAGTASAKPAAPKSDPAIAPAQDLPANTLPPALTDPPPTAPAPVARPADGNAVDLRFQPAPLEPDDVPLPINLATALRLSDARPLMIAATQASVWVAEAQLKRARVLWVPKLVFGADYVRHDGGGPDFNKGILTAPSVNFFYAGGGIHQILNLTDAIFEPLAARQALKARHADVQASKNDALLATAEAYFAVHEARGSYAGALYAANRGRDLVERVDRLAGDLAPADEAQRARNMLAMLEQQATSAREAWRVGSADLTQVLRLDPRAVVVPLEDDHLQVTLIDPAKGLDELMPIALATRPELASNQASVEAAEARVRREKMRPVLPEVRINGFQAPGGMYLQAGVFGIGPNSSLNQFTGRFDMSYQLVWQLEAFGIGNVARIKRQRGDQSRAIVELTRWQDRVGAEVTAAHAALQSAAARVGQADRALKAASETFNGNFAGLQQTQRFGDVLVLVNRPQEVVFSLTQLKVSLDNYFFTVGEYNRAQFRMFHALGYPAGELANLRPPGEVGPVDISRPAYLPPVGTGPPPASR